MEMAAEGSTLVRTKPKLHDEILPGVTYRHVRDGLRGLGSLGCGWHDWYITQQVLRQPLSIALKAEGKYQPGSSATNMLWDAHNGGVVKHELAKKLHSMRSDLLQALLKEQIIEQSKLDDCYERGERFTSVSGVRGTPAFPYTKGNAILHNVIKAAQNFNAMNGPLYFVTQIHAFGSLLRQSGEINDVDICYLQKLRPEVDRKNLKAAFDRRFFEIRGRECQTFLDATAEHESRQALRKAGSARLHLCGESDLDFLREEKQPVVAIYDLNNPTVAESAFSQFPLPQPVKKRATAK